MAASEPTVDCTRTANMARMTRFLSFVLLVVGLASCTSTLRTRAADGALVEYAVRGSGPTALVFLHGWCCDRAFWHQQLDAFSADYRVVTIDFATYPGSRTHWRIVDLASDVQAVADALDLQQMVLIGHSMGGSVSLAAAHRMPGRVLAVVGIDALHDAESPFPRQAFDELVQSFESDFPAAMRRAVDGMVRSDADPQLRAWISERASAANPEAALALLRDFPNLDLPTLLRNAGVPVRCINAAAPYATAIETNRKYADFDAVIMEDVGHFPMLERPVAFNARLREMLQGLPR